MELGELLLVPVKEREMATVRERGESQEGEERSRGRLVVAQNQEGGRRRERIWIGCGLGLVRC